MRMHAFLYLAVAELVTCINIISLYLISVQICMYMYMYTINTRN